jgi:hypothetical protein
MQHSGMQVHAIQKAMMHYAESLDMADSLMTQPTFLPACVRMATHALYGLQTTLNTLAIASGYLPLASSAYV